MEWRGRSVPSVSSWDEVTARGYSARGYNTLAITAVIIFVALARRVPSSLRALINRGYATHDLWEWGVDSSRMLRAVPPNDAALRTVMMQHAFHSSSRERTRLL